MDRFVAGRFSDIHDSKIGKDILKVLTDHDNIIRMETASELGRPALEPLSDRLIARFGDAVRADRVKQFIGYAARQVMESQGFQLDAQGVKVRVGELFTVASRYRRAAKAGGRS
jgi:hypothetical protein